MWKAEANNKFINPNDLITNTAIRRIPVFFKGINDVIKKQNNKTFFVSTCLEKEETFECAT